jgi:hypothetical protein
VRAAIVALLLVGCAPPSGPVAWKCAEAEREIAVYQGCAANEYGCARRLEFAYEKRADGRCITQQSSSDEGAKQ